MQGAAPSASESLDLVYLLAEYPRAISTFITGELKELAPLVASLAVYGLTRTDEPDLRPGGIPRSVRIGWAPRASDAAFWAATARAAAIHRRAYVREVAAIASRATGASLRLKFAHLAARAAAVSVRLPEKRGARRHVHAHFARAAAVAAHSLSRLAGVPYSMTAHAYDIFLPNPHLQMLVRDAALTVAISEFGRGQILSRVPGADAERVKVIHVGVPSRELAEFAAGRRPAASASQREPLIVSVGRLVPKKGMHVLLEAIRLLDDSGRTVRCEIVGDGPQREALQAAIARMRLGDRVRLLGAAPPADTLGRVAAADLFVLACRPEADGDMDGIPVALMEAMACGVPPISTRLSGIPELIEDGVSGRLAEPGDAESLAAAIAIGLDDRATAAAWAREGQRVVGERFDQATNARRLLDAILAARPAASA